MGMNLKQKYTANIKNYAIILFTDHKTSHKRLKTNLFSGSQTSNCP